VFRETNVSSSTTNNKKFLDKLADIQEIISDDKNPIKVLVETFQKLFV